MSRSGVARSWFEGDARIFGWIIRPIRVGRFVHRVGVRPEATFMGELVLGCDCGAGWQEPCAGMDREQERIGAPRREAEARREALVAGWERETAHAAGPGA